MIHLGYIKSYLVLPSMIYGIAAGRLVDLGIQNKFSTQIPQLIKAALGRGRGGTVGAGTNKWVNVHIDDGGHIISPISSILTMFLLLLY